jgi:hypothetical protein
VWTLPEHFKVVLGGNAYIDTPTLIEAHGEPLLVLRRNDANGCLDVRFDIYNESGTKLAVVGGNEIYPVADVASAYAREETADRLVFREVSTSRTLCEIRRREDAEDCELTISARLYTSKGVRVVVTPMGTNICGSFQWSGDMFWGNRVAIKLR